MFKTMCSVLALSLVLVACGGGSGDPSQATTDPDAPPVVSRVDVRAEDSLYPYRQDSPYAAVLKQCSLATTVDASCTLDTLPFITQAKPDFDRSDVLDRLLVTHDWMGKRFEALLDDAPASMIPLFGSVTAISIGSTIRPSNYWSLTGAIRLDPANLWLSVAEKANVSTQEDFRQGFGADLQFWAFGTYRNGNQPAYDFYNLTDTRERNYNDIKLRNYTLWYHELAHAVDYLPNESVATLDNTLKTGDALFQNDYLFLSPQFVAEYPLYSDVMLSLAQVSFRGEEATNEQKRFYAGLRGIGNGQ